MVTLHASTLAPQGLHGSRWGGLRASGPSLQDAIRSLSMKEVKFAAPRRTAPGVWGLCVPGDLTGPLQTHPQVSWVCQGAACRVDGAAPAHCWGSGPEDPGGRAPLTLPSHLCSAHPSRPPGGRLILPLADQPCAINSLVFSLIKFSLWSCHSHEMAEGKTPPCSDAGSGSSCLWGRMPCS